MANEILTARKGPVLEITLNRPEIGNAASDAMAVELTKLLLGAGRKLRDRGVARRRRRFLRRSRDHGQTPARRSSRMRLSFAAATTWSSTATAPSAAAKSP